MKLNFLKHLVKMIDIFVHCIERNNQTIIVILIRKWEGQKTWQSAADSSWERKRHSVTDQGIFWGFTACGSSCWLLSLLTFFCSHNVIRVISSWKRKVESRNLMAAVMLLGRPFDSNVLCVFAGNGHAGRNSGPVEGQHKVWAPLTLL